jgi:GNAT superfamily N-acetyltransferase
MTRYQVDQLETPADPHDPDLAALLTVEHAVSVQAWGHQDFHDTPQEHWARVSHQSDSRYVDLVVRDDGVAGYALVELPRAGNAHLGYVELGVAAGLRGRGIGSALFDAGVDLVRQDGRDTLFICTDQRSEPAPGPGTLAPSTGAGLVSTDDPGVRFLRRRGLTLEQVDRYSVLQVPLDPDVLAGHLSAAQAVASADYDLVTWQDPCPDERVDDFAALVQAMSTDAPVGGLDWREDPWDAARVRRAEGKRADAGQQLLTTGAVHRRSSRLVAFTSFFVPQRPDFVWQHDTLVHRDHRGHRLGMLVKAANLQRLAAQRPQVRRVGTWNAEENAHMLAINVALGFAPSGGSATWQLTW